MKLWLTPSEIVELALPGLPGTKRNINMLAEREGWATQTRFARPRFGRGGGMEYHIDLLPLEARVAFAARFAEGGADAGADAIAELPDEEAGLVPSAALSARDARIHIIGAARAFRKTSDLTHGSALALYVDLYNAGQTDAPSWVRQQLPRLSRRSLARWLAAQRDGSIERLAIDRGAARRDKGVIDQAENGRLRIAVLGLMAKQPHLSVDHIRTIMLDRFGDTVEYRGGRVEMPSVRDFQRRISRYRIIYRNEFMAITNPDAFLNQARISGSYAKQITRLNEQWQIDASPADVLCVDGRWSIYVCIDVYSRRIITYVSRTPRADAVGLLLRKAITAWGVPERIKTDNGSDFTARVIRRFMAALNIEIETSHAYSPWEKGVVERAIGTVQRDFMPLLPGFIGHDVQDRQALRSRKRFAEQMGQSDQKTFCVELSGDELASILDDLAENRYAHRPHGGLNKRTPFMVTAAWRGAVRRIDDAHALAVLLAPVAGQDGRRTVGKQGVRVDGVHYLCASLMPGETVFVRKDPADMGRVWIFEEDGETFRCEAVAPEFSGVDPAALIAAAKAEQKRVMEERLAPIKAEMRTIKPRDMVEAVARQAAQQAGKLVELPKPSTVHETPALDGAMDAIRAPRRSQQPVSEVDRTLLAQIAAELQGNVSVQSAEPQNVHQLRTELTPQQRYRRMCDLEARLAQGSEISSDDALWLGGYRQTAEARALRAVEQDLGGSQSS